MFLPIGSIKNRDKPNRFILMFNSKEKIKAMNYYAE